MVFPILPANTLSGGYNINNSLRFNDGDLPYLTLSPASSGSARIASFSCWFKRSSLGSEQRIFASSGGTDETDEFCFAGIDSSDRFLVTAGSRILRLNRLFRDVSAWYSAIVIVDVSQSTVADRCSIYINGVLESSFETDSRASILPQNTDRFLSNSSGQYSIGRRGGNDEKYFDGYLAEVHFIDGIAKAHTDFGEFDEDSGIWKPIEYTGGSYGTNGFFLEFQGSGATGESDSVSADTSGEDNDFAFSGISSFHMAMTDSPTNNFCTLNPLINSYVDGALSEGNLKLVSGSSSWGHKLGTMAVTNGK